jgi:hypothetical protein
MMNGSRTAAFGAVLSVTCLVGAPAPAASSDEAHVQIRVTDHRDGIADFSEFWVKVGEVALHRAGYSRHEGWVSVLHDAPAVDIRPLKDGRWATVGEASLPSGRYNAMLIVMAAVRGTLQSGVSAPLSSLRTSMAIEITLEPGSDIPILIDLSVDDQTDHDPAVYVPKLRRVIIGNGKES